MASSDDLRGAVRHVDRRNAIAVIVLLAAGVYAGGLATASFLGAAPKHRVETAWLIFVPLALVYGVVRHRRPPAPAGRRQPISLRGLAACAVGFILLSGGLYAAAFSIGLLSDDFPLLARAGAGDFFSASQFLRPVPLLAWAAMGWLGASQPVALHGLNTALHGLNAALVFALAQRLGASAGKSAAAGALFLVFPASVEAVAWVSGLQDLLLTTFCLLFVLGCAPGRQPPWALAGTLLALLGALGSKETAVVAPALAFVVWFRHPDGWNWRPAALGAILVALYVPVRYFAIAVDQAFAAPPSRYFAKEILSRLFGSLAVPFSQGELLRFPVLGIAASWLMVALVFAALRGWRGPSPAGPLRFVVWAVLSVVPVWSMFYVSGDLQGSRYLYLASAGWSLLLAFALLDTPGLPRRLGHAVLVVLGVAGIAGLQLHLRDWQEAARLRDRVISSAVAQLRDTACETMSFTGIPDSVGGAYVFRNGFEEALGRAGGFTPTVRVGQPTSRDCTREWDGVMFRPITLFGQR